MEDQLKSIFVRLFGVDANSIQPDSSPKSIPKWDSLTHMSLVLSIEEQFGVQFSDEEIPRMLDWKTILELIKAKQAT